MSSNSGPSTVPSALDIPGLTVRTDEPTRRKYAEDQTEIEPHLPDAVVEARTVEEVVNVVKACARAGLPLVPVVGNSNIGGLAIPSRGGVVLDLKPMNRILEINDEEMYALIEPGVTWGQIRDELEKHPRLAFGYSLAPPDVSVMGNCLMDGLTTLSLKHGSTANWVNGVEAVLASGDVIRTGIAALVPNWSTNSPMPDLTGLFLNMHGTTGVVTKMAVQLWPRRAFRKRFLLLAKEVEPALAKCRELARNETVADIGILTGVVTKMALGAKRPKRAAGDPALAIIFDVSASLEGEFNARVAEVRACGDLVDADFVGKLLPDLAKLMNLPARLDFLLDRGLTWIGTYGPPSKWAEGIAIGTEIMERHGFPPAIVLRPMLLGHYGVLRLLCTFDKATEVDRVRAMNAEIVDRVVDLGFVPYKTPPWVVDRIRPRINPAFLKTLAGLRAALDPAGIMNPGKWPTS